MEKEFWKKIKVECKERIDKYIAKNIDLSRNVIKDLIKEKCVFVNKINVRKPHFIVKKNDEIKIIKLIDKEQKIIAEKIALDIIHEDEDIIIINKPSNLVVHPAPGHKSKTLVNGLLYHFKNLSSINGNTRPGIVHRIDKDTSGLLVVAKNNFAHNFLAKELKNHNIKRIYYAIVVGKINNHIIHINLPIARDINNRKKMSIAKNNSKNAITHVFVEKTSDDFSLIRCELETGRTHQIRVHLSYINHPIYGDSLYGKKVDDFNQRLHAYSLSLIHPQSKKEMTFFAKIPKEFKEKKFDFFKN